MKQQIKKDMNKYNIAFIPQINLNQFVNYAHEAHEIVNSGTYLLGNRSIPHVSLCHFEAERHQIQKIWEEVQGLNIAPIKLIFNKIRSKSYFGHPQWSGVSWVSLISDHLDRLKEIHLSVAGIIKKPLNASFEHYDPHLTLLNSYDDKAYLFFNENNILSDPLEDTFVIALGPIDENGQLLEISYI